ncbi:Methyl-accepting chemotaxis protein McpC [Paenibacillus auburnensis]|jgi:methyl-accepting chemotaxis protein|uniref:Methyl-accepting chemotaxis protein McpC n=1 Tax=Paenibacillus auburnensis TaxID=2905649 RepID=A0ABN8FXM5_9BACL|nr:HAMP domain-containing methyl-accepting chemotaxis protein [Paenibacillus auburnensis]CAH1194401.1 Methyl-accepting chemotaxis protein McpC [Paenibacillus auburnensis]
MNWMTKLPLKQRIVAGCYLVAALFAVPVLITMVIMGKIILGIVLVAALAGLTYPLARYVERTLTSSFDDISNVTHTIAKGDFTLRADENGSMGEVSRSFNTMIDKLKKILTEASQITRQVMDASRGIEDKNQNLKIVMAQVASSSNELAQGANEISVDIADMTDSIKDIEIKVSNYTSSTKEMNKRSIHTLELVEKGRLSVDTQAEGMRKNIEATNKVASTIETLSQNARGISMIAKSITEIAEQTNLLSLNASIEAARAGEHGRGFAVVAQEVRKLAEESTSSTKEVFGLVRSIEADIKQAVENIAINEEVVQVQNEMIVETAHIFSQIVQSVQYITEQISAFSAESDLMLESALKISSAIENISAITQQTAAGTEEVSAAMNEQINALQSVAEETDKMTQAVFQLQKTIHIFKF